MGKQPLAVSSQQSAKTWGDIFRKWKFKGADPAYAAHMADRYEARHKQAQCREPFTENRKPKTENWSNQCDQA